MTGLTYDTGALIASDRNQRLVWSLHQAALKRGFVPVVPAGVIGEAWRGGPQHRMSGFLKGCQVEPLTEAQACAVGVLAKESGLDDTVDLAVAEGAMRRNDIVVTPNRAHIERVGDSVARAIVIHDV